MEKYSQQDEQQSRNPYQVEKVNVSKPNPLQNNKLNRDTLILLSSQIREIKQKMTSQMCTWGKMSQKLANIVSIRTKKVKQ